MAADGRHARGLHAGRTATDDHDVLGIVGLLELEAHLLHGLRVDGAAELGVAVPDAADAVFVAAQAGTHILGVAGHELVGELRVGDQGAAHVGEVDHAGLDELERCVGTEGARGEERHVHGLARGPADVGHAGLAQVAGREDVVEGLVAARVHVKGVHARRLENLEELDAVLDRATALEAMVERDAEDHGHDVADDALDGLDNLRGEARAALGGAAVLVRALVPDRGHELVDEVARVRVDLHRVEACVARDACGELEVLHDVRDLILGEGVALHVGVKDRRRVRGGDGRIAQRVREGVAAGAGADLADDLGAIAMTAVHDGGEARENRVGVQVTLHRALG